MRRCPAWEAVCATLTTADTTTTAVPRKATFLRIISDLLLGIMSCVHSHG
jgi:hypothetical protein